MGINIQTLKFLLEENQYLPLYGDILLIGRSTVTISDIRVSKLFEKFGLSASHLLNPKKNTSTRHSVSGYHIDDIELFKSLSDNINSVSVLDISEYEGASIKADLNYPVSEEYHNQFDFIYDSSVLDNIFNPAQGIVNICNLLKSRGRILHLHHSSFFPGSLVACNPEWFYGFYSCNKFFDLKLYLAEQSSVGWNRFEFETNLYKYKPSYTYNKNYNRFLAASSKSSVYYSLCFAQADAEWGQREIIFPSNLQYISSSEKSNWAIQEDNFNKTSRPLVGGNSAPKDIKNFAALPLSTDHYEFLMEKF